MYVAIGHFSYSVKVVPSEYKCYKCGIHGVKLWRDYQAFLDDQELTCSNCSAKQQEKDISTLRPDGKYLHSESVWTDQIGWLVPAVPTEEGDNLWGYTSVPPEGVNWWKNLPSTPS